jgi:hypothetical protein
MPFSQIHSIDQHNMTKLNHFISKYQTFVLENGFYILVTFICVCYTLLLGLSKLFFFFLIISLENVYRKIYFYVRDTESLQLGNA